jgi:hypothetical protein
LPNLRYIFALLAAGLAIAFLVWTLGNSERRVESVDSRGAADLAVLTDTIDQWVRAADAIGKSNVDRGGRSLYHPKLEQIELAYAERGSGCATHRALLPRSSELPPRLHVAGEVKGTDPAAAAARPCYEVRLPLPPMLPVQEMAPLFSHLLIADSQGRVIAQLGGDALPITQILDVPKLEHDLSEVARQVDPKHPKADAAAARDAVQPIDTRIAGKKYRIYQRPFTLPHPSDAGVEAPAAAAAGADPSVRTGPDRRTSVKTVPPVPAGASYIAIGIAPVEKLRSETREVPLSVITGFALAFALLLALMPILKLRLLGPVDDLAPAEAVAVVLGLLVAVWVATFSVGYSIMLLNGREDGEQKLVQTARWIASDTGDELHRILFDWPGSGRSPLLKMFGSAGGAGGAGGEKISFNPYTSNGRIVFPQPDIGLFVDRQGDPIPPVRAAAIEAPGANFALGERRYFREALRGDLVPIAAEASGNARDQLILPDGIRLDRGRYAMGQVRSLPDAVERTVLAFPVEAPAPGTSDPEAPREAAVLAMGFPLRSLLSPLLPAGIGFMVYDIEDPARRALFHSTPARALAEPLAGSITGGEVEPALRQLQQRLPLPCKGKVTANKPIVFSARYDGRQHMFAADRLPCTRWAVLTHVPLDSLDRTAARSTLSALGMFFALTLLVAVFLLTVSLLSARRLWTLIWPDPRCSKVYGRAAFWIGAAGAVGAAMLLATILLAWKSIIPWAMLVFLFPALGAAILWAGLGRSRAAQKLRALTGWGSCAEGRQLLSPATEKNYRRLVVAILVLVGATPAAIQVVDAYRFQRAETAAARDAQELRAALRRSQRLVEVARSYDLRLPPDARDMPPIGRSELAASPRDPTDFGNYRLTEVPREEQTGTEWLRNIAYHGSDRGAVQRLAPQGIHDDTIRQTPARAHLPAIMMIALLALALCALIYFALRTALSGLFGFGTPLEAVEQPAVRPWSWEGDHFPMIVVGAPPTLEADIRQKGQPFVIDLVEETSTDSGANTANKALPDPKVHPRVVVENLELLLRDPLRRIQALRLLERLVACQRDNRGARLVVLTDLSPLERLLQRYERDSEVLEKSDDEEARKQLEDIKRNREDVRWSRLFATFHTFSHNRITPPVPRDSGTKLVAEVAPKLSPAKQAQRAAIAQRVIEELSPLPGHVVTCGLPTPTKVIKGRSAIEQQALAIAAPSPQAVVDHYTSMFIEYYQLIWSASSLAERLIMYHLAHGRLVSISRAYALRNLTRRGLVVLDPVPRLFNRSFAQFVRNVEKPETLKRWQRDAPRGAWRLAQLPVLFLVPAGLVVLVLLVRQSGQSAFAFLPLLVSAAPLLLQGIGLLRRPSQA